jgi:formate dehydrogenase iron-sulfur subunit
MTPWTEDQSDIGGTGGRPGAVGFLTDTTLCIGCKACEVACKEWNQLPAELDDAGPRLTGFSYDNTVDLGATTWRHVAFVERTPPASSSVSFSAIVPDAALAQAPPVAWLMMSDVCKHCVHAGCLEACPTGAIIRTEFDTVVIQQDICNGCGYCVPACPFGVPQLGTTDHRAHKCTLCYDRLVEGLEPACAKACPTDSIQFGLVAELLPRAVDRVAELRARGEAGAHLYGDRRVGGTHGIDGLNALFVLTASPETYNLPAAPRLPQDKVLPALLSTAATAIGLGLVALAALRNRR